MRTNYVVFCAAMVLAVATMSVRADMIVQSGLITFDTLAPTANSVVSGHTVRPGDLTSIQISTAGVTVTISREGGAHFDLVNNFLSTQTGKPDAWGTDLDSDGDVQAGTADRSVSLDGFCDTRNLGFVFSFSDAIQGFSLLAGDFGRDLDQLQLSAYSGANLTGTLLNAVPVTQYLPATSNSNWTQTRFDIVNAAGFRSILFRGGLGDFDVFVDRVFISLSGIIPPDNELDDAIIDGDGHALVVPEPLTISVIALAGIAALRRRRA